MQKNKSCLALGLMSGTSADGLSICLFDIKAKRVLAFKNYPYTKFLQNKILAAADLTAAPLAQLSFELGHIYAKKTQQFLKTFQIHSKDICVIGSHGQTITHSPNAKTPNTLQIGEASFLALQTGLPVVCDFRPMDIAAGGTGAPLIPFFDDYLFSKAKPIIFLNIGGISNAAAVGHGIKPFGFDIGPGNAMIDSAINLLTHGKLLFDKDGKLAGKYKPDIQKAQQLLKLFIGARPPKSLDRNDFALPFINQHFPDIKAADIATITYLTALIMAESLKKFILKTHSIKTIAVNGGGFYNKTLMAYMAGMLADIKIISLQSLGIPPMAKEAAAFAFFAYNTINGRPSNCMAATGAKRTVVLGKIIKA